MTGPTGAVHVALERVIRRALAIQPGDRFKDMVAMQGALAAVRGQIPQPVFSGSGNSGWSSDTMPADGFPQIGEGSETSYGTRLLRVGVGVGALCAIALGGWLVSSRAPSDGGQPVSTQAPAATTQRSSDVLPADSGRRTTLLTADQK